MKYQMTVDGVLVADYYNLEKAVDHTRVALEDARFTTVQLSKVNDDGSAYSQEGEEALAAEQPSTDAYGQPVPAPSFEQPAVDQSAGVPTSL